MKMPITQKLRFALLSFVFVSFCALSAPAPNSTYANPVLPGDFPDPTIMRLGDDYWASATSSEWAPIFPLLHSRDLVHWTCEGAVFSRPPSWTIAKFWAPEMCSYHGKIYLYYVAQQKGGELCIGVATADKPAGPYTDHGPLVIEPGGAIDPMAITDDDGQRYLIWKADGNARQLPTPIYAQKLTDDGLKLDGPRKELIRNDSPWEGAIIEGPFVIKHGGQWYLFYAGGNGCCGHHCQYGAGVARAGKLLGPYEKCPANPVLAANEQWKCPGHGSLVETPDGRTFFLCHSYSENGSIYVGRQGVIDEVTWNAGGWPVVNKAQGPSSQACVPLKSSEANNTTAFQDDFTSTTLNPRWHWPQSSPPKIELKSGALRLSPSVDRADNILGAILAVRTTEGNYTATTLLDLGSISSHQAAGLFAVGNYQNALGIYVRDGRIHVVRRRSNKDEELGCSVLPEGKKIYLRLSARDGHRFRFSCCTPEQPNWKQVGGDTDLEGDYLPPWDRGVRVALTAGGTPETAAAFNWVRMVPGKAD